MVFFKDIAITNKHLGLDCFWLLQTEHHPKLSNKKKKKKEFKTNIQ